MENFSATGNGKKEKKEFRKFITNKIELALADVKMGVKEKKFKSAVKRAAKLLANDLYKKTKKDKKKEEAIVTEVPELVGA